MITNQNFLLVFLFLRHDFDSSCSHVHVARVNIVVLTSKYIYIKQIQSNIPKQLYSQFCVSLVLFKYLSTFFWFHFWLHIAKKKNAIIKSLSIGQQHYEYILLWKYIEGIVDEHYTTICNFTRVYRNVSKFKKMSY